MRRSVIVKVKGVTENEEGLEDAVSTEAFGVHHEKDGIHYISYEEAAGSGPGTIIKNLLKVGSGSFCHKKSGAVESDMFFKTGEEYSCRYCTEYGIFEIDMKTLYYRLTFNGGLPRIETGYELMMSGQPVGVRKLEIEVLQREDE